MIKFTSEKKNADDTVIGSSYFLNGKDSSGKSCSIELDGDETVSTLCPDCRNEFTVAFGTFMEFMRNGDIYSTMIFCKKCSKLRNQNIERGE